MHFRLYPLRFAFLAREPIHFPPGKSSNLLRGAFGAMLRQLACAPACERARDCPSPSPCPYARLFEPAAVSAGPSGFADLPRPFVFRASHLDGCTIPPGTGFWFDLNLFDVRDPALELLASAFSHCAQQGLGPQRGRAELQAVVRTDDGSRIYDGRAMEGAGGAPMALDLEPAAGPAGAVRVRFVTPTELKSGDELAERPEFPILIARIRDRLSKLRELYGEGPLELDFRAFAARAAAIKLTRCDLRQVTITRRSTRTGQVHSIGGFTGEAEYEGNLAEFIPYLRAAKWTGVGRQTVWGKGELEVAVQPNTLSTSSLMRPIVKSGGAAAKVSG